MSKLIEFLKHPKKLFDSIRNIKDVEFNGPYIILLGGVGVGKSTIVEMLTGATGLSSSSGNTFTRESRYFWTKDKKLLVADTPGINPRSEKFDHNIQTAAAFNIGGVSKVFIVVKAGVRMDETIDAIKGINVRFLDLSDFIGVLITYTDIDKGWNEEDMRKACKDDLGITDVVFSRKGCKSKDVKNDILATCRLSPKQRFDITSRSFLRMFEFVGNDRNIIKVMNDLVYDFKNLKACFETEKEDFTSDEQADLFFQFKAFMELQVEECKKEMCKRLGFDFCQGDKENIEHAGYLASMVNQLRVIIYDIRIQALQYYNDHGCRDMRKCPHCGCIWAKVEGCSYTYCGDVPTEYAYDTSKKMKVSLANFSFSIEDGDLVIKRNGEKKLGADDVATKDKSKKVGCGKVIYWDDMPPVETPKEFQWKPKVTVHEISCLPDDAGDVFDAINEQLQKKQKKVLKSNMTKK